MKKIFVCEEHEEYGSKGWRVDPMPNFDPLDGMAVAHDVLEHAPHTTDSMQDEMMAFGAMYLVRGEDYFSNKGQYTTNPAKNQCGEVADMLRKVKWGDIQDIADCPYSKKNADIQEWIDELIQLTRKHIRDEFDGEFSMTDRQEKAIRGWVAEGYRRALKRYHHVNRYQLPETFQKIEDRSNEILKYAEIGDKLTVRVTFKDGQLSDNRWPDVKITVKSVYDQYGQEY